MAPVLPNLAFNGREEIRKTALTPIELRDTMSSRANLEIYAVRKRMCTNIIKCYYLYYISRAYKWVRKI